LSSQTIRDCVGLIPFDTATVCMFAKLAAGCRESDPREVRAPLWSLPYRPL